MLRTSMLRTCFPTLGALVFSTTLVHAQGALERSWPNTDFSRTAVAAGEIMSGGPGKDGIPAIDAPVFVDVESASTWIEELEPVILLRQGEEAKAYPLQIMTYHEIVNDTIGSVPVAVTFCPLCNASIVFDRRVQGRLLDFGTTGLLRKSDLVMYDRQTESWWQQFSGDAIVGEMMGVELERIPAEILSFRAVAERFPAARVLSRDTGHRRPYGRNPYPGYDRIGQRPFLFSDDVDERLPAMERVLGVRVGEEMKIYPHEALAGRPVINDRVGDEPIVVLAMDQARSALDAASFGEARLVHSASAFRRRADDRELSFRLNQGVLEDEQTGSRWNRFGEAVAGPLRGQRLELMEGGSHFAFAWLAFNPDSEIYSTE